MKKQLLTLALLGMGIANAQTWSEDFNATTAQNLPAGWLQNNVDGLTVSSSLSSFNFGTNAWVTNNIATVYPNQGRCVMSTSWYNPAGVADDWLITPSFNVPAGAYLEWEATCSEAAFADGYQVKISTTGTLTTDFSTNLLTVAAENYATSAWTERSINLSAYVGQSVRIAFRNNSNDKNRLYLDNIKVVVPPTNNGNVVSVTSVPRYTVGGNTVISGVFKNKGTAVANNATMNYQIDAGPIVTETLSVGALNYLQTANYSFVAPAALTVGTHTVKVWVTQVNGVNETVTVDDQATAMTYVASQSVAINALVEEFTSSTCGPCASLNSSFDPLLTSNNANQPASNLNAIKYQVNWPSPGNDPSYNPDVTARVTYYDVNAAPTVLYNGVEGSGNQTNINIAKMAPAYANITSTITFSAGAVTANATVTPFLTIPSASPIRIYQALVQSYYNYPGASTSQKDYKHAMRKMFPTNGTTYTTTDGTPINVTFNHALTYGSVAAGTPAQGSFNFWTNTGTFTYEYLVWVQDDVTNQVLQSSSAFTSSVTVPSSITEYSNNGTIGIFPNPAKDYAVVGVKLDNSSFVEISITDITGKVVYSNKADQVFAGTSEITINTSEFATGTYNVLVKTNGGLFNEKLIVVK